MYLKAFHTWSNSPRQIGAGFRGRFDSPGRWAGLPDCEGAGQVRRGYKKETMSVLLSACVCVCFAMWRVDAVEVCF